MGPEHVTAIGTLVSAAVAVATFLRDRQRSSAQSDRYVDYVAISSEPKTSSNQRGPRPFMPWLAAAGILAILTFVLVRGGDPGDSSSSPSSPAMPVPPVTSSAIMNASASPFSECVDRQGNEVPCGSDGAGLVKNISPCTTDVALKHVAVSPVPQVDLSAEPIHELCILFPGTIATEAGASAIDIAALEAGEKAAKLRLCLTKGGGVEVACSEPHLIEYVGPWTAPNESPNERLTECDIKAREYTRLTFSKYNSPLKVVLATRGDGYYRCGVESSKSLNDSLSWAP